MSDSDRRSDAPLDDLKRNPVDSLASQRAWRAFETGAAGLGSPIAAPSPQILTGEFLIPPPGVPDPDSVLSWWQPSGSLNVPATWNEVWDVAEPQDLDLGFRVQALGPLAPHFDPVAFLAQPPANQKWRAHMQFQYLSPPSPQDVAAFVQTVPQGVRHLLFRVQMSPPDAPPTQLAGNLYRVRHGMDVVDFWALWANYLGPEVGLRDLVVEPEASPTGGPAALQAYLDNIPPDALFVAVAYTWQS